MSVGKKGSYDLEAHIKSAKHTKQIQSCHNITKVNECFIKQNSNTEEQAVVTEGEMLFHAVKYYIGDNYSLHSVLFFTHKFWSL
jgi:hypothetical protein